MADCILTTVDNPYDPFTNFEEWYKYDMIHGYDTCGYLARVANTSENLSDEINEDEIDYAMDQIINTEPLLYKKVFKDKT